MNERKNNQTKQTKNRREYIVGFVHVSLFFVVTTIACCFILFYYSNNSNVFDNKKFAIDKMKRIQDFRSVQNEQAVIVDSIYSIIGNFNPTIQASYKENDIKHYLNGIKNLYEKSGYDRRYKIFYQTADFYNMWFADKQELWAKRRNIDDFKKNLEDCRIGFQKKQDELKNTN